ARGRCEAWAIGPAQEIVPVLSARTPASATGAPPRPSTSWPADTSNGLSPMISPFSLRPPVGTIGLVRPAAALALARRAARRSSAGPAAVIRTTRPAATIMLDWDVTRG